MQAGEGAGLTKAQIDALDGMFKVTAFSTDPTSAYTTFKTAFGIGSTQPEPPVPEPPTPSRTLQSISATYSGGDVPVGTTLTTLTGIVVTAHYSDGSTEQVSGYQLSGTIVKGLNTITVTYQSKTTTFTVNGIERVRKEYKVLGTFPAKCTWNPITFNIEPALEEYTSHDIEYDAEIDVQSVSSQNVYLHTAIIGRSTVGFGNTMADKGKTGTLKFVGKQVSHATKANKFQVCCKTTDSGASG